MTATVFEFVPGWVDTPERHALAASVGPEVRDTDAMWGQAPTSDALLYKAWKDVLGKYPDYAPQAIGDCESFGHAHGNDLLQCVEASLSGSDVDYQETCTEAAYALGREAGGMLGRTDGCYGSAMVKSMTTVGMLSRGMVSPPEYSGTRAKQWGYSGLPASLKSVASQFKLGGAALVRTTEECDAALSSGYPVTVSSSQGFTMVRDADGFCRAKGRWDHCMLICGMRLDRKGYLIRNNWPLQLYSGPLALDQPEGSFWADAATVASMLAGGDSFALSRTAAFRKRALPASWTSAHLI